MFEQIGALYRESRKPHDIFWNTYVSRPIAAALVYLLRKTHVTPNQVTFASLAVAGFGFAALIVWRTWVGLVAASLILQTSYILDCADGQLARYKNMTTPVGAHLDFLMDELKALGLVAAVTVRLWCATRNQRFLLLGLAGLGIVAAATSLTTFMRRPEYAPPPPPTGFAPPPRAASPLGWLLLSAERAAKLVAHYPTYFILIALFDRLDGFLYAYVGIHALYLARALGQVIVRLGKGQPS